MHIGGPGLKGGRQRDHRYPPHPQHARQSLQEFHIFDPFRGTRHTHPYNLYYNAICADWATLVPQQA